MYYISTWALHSFFIILYIEVFLYLTQCTAAVFLYLGTALHHFFAFNIYIIIVLWFLSHVLRPAFFLISSKHCYRLFKKIMQHNLPLSIFFYHHLTTKIWFVLNFSHSQQWCHDYCSKTPPSSQFSGNIRYRHCIRMRSLKNRSQKGALGMGGEGTLSWKLFFC